MGIYKEDDSKVTINFEKSIVNEESNLVSGWASVSYDKDGKEVFDWQGDLIPPAELEKAAVNFMECYRESGTNHTSRWACGTVVESIVFTEDKIAALGLEQGLLPIGWFITVHVWDQEVFESIKNGAYKMFSIQGRGIRTPRD